MRIRDYKAEYDRRLAEGWYRDYRAIYERRNELARQAGFRDYAEQRRHRRLETVERLPTGTIGREVFIQKLTDSQREAVRDMMVSHGININVVASLELHESDVVYTIYKTNDEGHRYLDAETGEVAVRTVRRKIRAEVSDDS